MGRQFDVLQKVWATQSQHLLVLLCVVTESHTHAQQSDMMSLKPYINTNDINAGVPLMNSSPTRRSCGKKSSWMRRIGQLLRFWWLDDNFWIHHFYILCVYVYIYIHIHNFIHPNYHSLGGFCYIWIKAGAVLTWTTVALVCRRCFKCGKYCRRVFSPPDSIDDALNVVLAGSPCVVIFSDTQIINIYTVFDTYCINVSWEKGCVRFSGLLVVWIWTGTTRCNNQKSSGLFEEHQAESPTRSGAWECVGFPNRNRHRTTSRFHVNLNKICL